MLSTNHKQPTKNAKNVKGENGIISKNKQTENWQKAYYKKCAKSTVQYIVKHFI